MSEELSIDTIEAPSELGDLAQSFEATHGLPPANHEAYAHVNAAIDGLGLDGNGTNVEYVDAAAERESLPKDPELQKIDEAAGTLKEAYDALLRLDEPMFETFRSPEWTTVFAGAKGYNEAVANIAWDKMPIESAEGVLRTVQSVGAAERILYDNKIAPPDTISLDTLVASGSIPADVLRGLYTMPPSSEPESLLRSALSADKFLPEERAKVLKTIYAESGGLDFVEAGKDELVDRVRADMGEFELSLFCIEDAPDDSTPEAIERYDSDMRRRMDHVLLDELHLHEKVVDLFYFAASSRLRSHDNDDEREGDPFDGSKVKASLQRIKASTEAWSPEGIDYLSRTQGLVNVDNYSPQDIVDLANLVGQDPGSVEARERMQQGDVTVVFADAFGDYNGAFEGTTNRYRQDGRATLLFEIQKPGDFYRRMIGLKKLGIKPSSIVIAAHGSPGVTTFGTGDSAGFELVTGVHAAEGGDGTITPVFLEDADLAQLVGDEFMKDDSQGKRRIILDSCSSAKELPGVMSSAERILTIAKRENLKVYGASEVTITEGSAQEGGVRFLKYDPKGRYKREKSIATEFSLQGSKVKRRSLQQIPNYSEEAAA